MIVNRNPNLGSSERRARRHRMFLVRFYIVLFLFLFVLFGLAILSGQDKMTVQSITVLNNASVSTDNILEIVNRDMAGRYWYLFSRKNFLIFPRFQIKDDLLREIMTLKEVNIDWAGWQKIVITIVERKPHSVWCESRESTATCFFVDKEGYIYSQAPVFSGGLFIKDYSNLSTSTSPLGQFFLPPEIYSQIFNLIDILDQNNLKVMYVSFDDFDFNFGLETGPTILFSSKNDIIVAFQNLFTALETGNLDLIKDASIINYIDLRFANKIVIGKKETND